MFAFDSGIQFGRMKPSCNIDARGKLARLIYGVVLLIISALLGWHAWNVHSTGWWIAAGCCAAGGAFAVYEARAGWCIVRAMGFKTPM
jgi:hypothetical protein